MALQHIKNLQRSIIQPTYESGAEFSPKRLQQALQFDQVLRLCAGRYMRKTVFDLLEDWEKQLAYILAYASTQKKFIASHLSAARLHDFPIYYPPQGIPEDEKLCFTSPTGSKSKIERVKVYRYLNNPLTTTLSGVRVTTPLQTAIDCLRELKGTQALVIADHALNKGWNPEHLISQAESQGIRRGLANMKRTLDQARQGARSAGATVLRKALTDLGMPEPALQHPVECSWNKYFVDLAWPRLGLVAEFTDTPKEGSCQKSVYKDRIREEALSREGWAVHSLNWEDLHDSAALKKRFHSYLYSSFS